MSVITYTQPGLEDPEIKTLIEESITHPYLGEIVRSRLTPDITLFRYDGTPVGYAIPRLEGVYWRVGPIYVKDEYRGKGVATSFIKAFYKGRRGRAYIEEGNVASIATFTGCGFVRTGKVMHNKDGKLFHQYQLEYVPKSLEW